MKTVLFIETGSGHGGSATCLNSMMFWLQKSPFRSIVAYYSSGVGIEQILLQTNPSFSKISLKLKKSFPKKTIRKAAKRFRHFTI